MIALSTLAALCAVFSSFQGIPSDPALFSKRYELPKVAHENVRGVDLWCEDGKIFDEARPLIAGAMAHLEKWLGMNPLKGKNIKIIIIKDTDKFTPILGDFNDELKKTGMAPVDNTYISQAMEAGSCSFSNPLFILIGTRVLTARAQRETRLIHTLGHFAGGYLVSDSGHGPPFLQEGVAGELVKKIIAKPDAIVCAGSAALKDTVQGYGVFAAIGSVANNTWNDPDAWGRMLQNVAKALRKPKAAGAGADKEGDAKVQVASLLARRSEEFRRADYGFTWSVCNYLFDTTKPPKVKDAPEREARRAIVLKAFADMRADYEAAGDANARIDLFRDRVMSALGLTAETLQKDWLDWAEKVYSKS